MNKPLPTRKEATKQRIVFSWNLSGNLSGRPSWNLSGRPSGNSKGVGPLSFPCLSTVPCQSTVSPPFLQSKWSDKSSDKGLDIVCPLSFPCLSPTMFGPYKQREEGQKRGGTLSHPCPFPVCPPLSWRRDIIVSCENEAYIIQLRRTGNHYNMISCDNRNHIRREGWKQ